jgi:hypothetical protein
VLSLPGSPALVLTVVAFGALAIASRRSAPRWAAPLFWGSTASLLALPLVLPEVIWPFFHYRARVLNGLLALALFGYLHARAHGRLLEAPRLSTPHLLSLAAALFLFQGVVTFEWQRHRNIFRAELASASGVVPFPSEGPFAEPRSRQFSWSWTTPTRSVVFQAMELGEVRAIMLNADTTLWQPFHPRVVSELPDLSAYGVRYAPALTGDAGRR